MVKQDSSSYLDEIRKETAGSRVTVYRNREWILEAVREGSSKRLIYDKLVEKEALQITYQYFARLVNKLLAESGEKQQKSPNPTTSGKPKKQQDRTKPPEDTGPKQFKHNPIPNEDELY